MPRAARRRTFNMDGLGQADPPGVFDSLGATFWEWMNPEQVRAEYELQNKAPPPDVQFADVIGASIEDARDVAKAAGAEISAGVDSLTKGARLATVALIVVTVAYLVWKVRK